MRGLEPILRFWPIFAAGLDLLACLLASVHVLLHKRDSRAATLWIGFIWLLPLLGVVLYFTLGVNRIRRRAVSLGVHGTFRRPVPDDLGEPEHAGAEHLQHLARIVNRLAAQPLVAGNKIEPLLNGDQAFPAMLNAIESAQRSVSLCTYIFDNDASGGKFVAALDRALRRGVKVRVLIDAAGARYSWPSILRRLRHAKIPCARFLPAPLFTPWRVATINLRNHRKSLVVDGQIAFTGGINIRHGNMIAEHPPRPVQDLHFRVTGPVVAELQAAFVNDWAFTTGEVLDADIWFPKLTEAGDVVARVITDGPDADFENLRLTLLAALGEAQSSVQILTPYFLPDNALITALNLAALRGVRVDIVLPAKINLPFVLWASRAMWWQVLERGCHVWLTPPPFDHSKLMIVDHHWVLLGSANWDTRSLRLNFELNVEGYGRAFAREMEKVVAKKLSAAREVSLAEIDARPLIARLRDAATRLFSPYL
ncbi:MAG TPA: phospholipase D-like domain-containing protein [Verrucomicrobiae bacterium]|nr:phospholipase D-like domain-containing protein [Verrucomicrobiae bacterium]